MNKSELVSNANHPVFFFFLFSFFLLSKAEASTCTPEGNMEVSVYAKDIDINNNVIVLPYPIKTCYFTETTNREGLVAIGSAIGMSLTQQGVTAYLMYDNSPAQINFPLSVDHRACLYVSGQNGECIFNYQLNSPLPAHYTVALRLNSGSLTSIPVGTTLVNIMYQHCSDTLSCPQ